MPARSKHFRPLGPFGPALTVALLAASAAATELSAQSRDTTAAAGVGSHIEPLELRLMAAAVDAIVAEQSDSSAVCLSIMADALGRRPPATLLFPHVRSRRHLTTTDDCPRTYASSYQVVDSLGQPIPDGRGEPPEGYVDPYRFRIGRPQFEHPDVAWLYVREFHKTAGRALVCVAREEDGQPRASCRVVDRWIS